MVVVVVKIDRGGLGDLCSLVSEQIKMAVVVIGRPAKT